MSTVLRFSDGGIDLNSVVVLHGGYALVMIEEPTVRMLAAGIAFRFQYAFVSLHFRCLLDNARQRCHRKDGANTEARRRVDSGSHVACVLARRIRTH